MSAGQCGRLKGGPVGPRHPQCPRLITDSRTQAQGHCWHLRVCFSLMLYHYVLYRLTGPQGHSALLGQTRASVGAQVLVGEISPGPRRGCSSERGGQGGFWSRSADCCPGGSGWALQEECMRVGAVGSACWRGAQSHRRLSGSPRRALNTELGDSVPAADAPALLLTPAKGQPYSRSVEGDPEYDRGSALPAWGPSLPRPLIGPCQPSSPAAGGNSGTACRSAGTGGR